LISFSVAFGAAMGPTWPSDGHPMNGTRTTGLVWPKIKDGNADIVKRLINSIGFIIAFSGMPEAGIFISS
jgi:hypothetical protein